MAPHAPALSPEQTLAARRPEFVAFVTARVRDAALAEDLVQAAFARALTHLKDVRDEAAVVAWFYRSLRNAVVDRHRRRATEERTLEALAVELDDRIEAAEVAPAQVCPCVLRVAGSLKPEYAEALQRIEVEDAAVRDFAAERGISSSNAAVRVYRAREALRRGVLATCGACADAGCVDCTCEPGPAEGTSDGARKRGSNRA